MRGGYEITVVLSPQLEKRRCDENKTTAEVVRGTYVSPVDVAPENSPSNVINKITVIRLPADQFVFKSRLGGVSITALVLNDILQSRGKLRLRLK